MTSNYQHIFRSLASDPRYVANLDWGKPRAGHPEGSIRAHIRELEANLESLRAKLTEDEYWKLKILIHTHDTFKPQSKEGIRIGDRNSHASLARSFLTEFVDDEDLLEMVQYHDESCALYLQQQRRGTFDKARFEALLKRIHDWNLFLAFHIIDGCTAGKSREPLHWLFRQIDGQVESKFTAADIIPADVTRETRKD